MRFLPAVFALAALVAPAQAQPFHHPFGEWREYHRDWLSACPDAIDEEATHFEGYSCFSSTGSELQNGAGLPAYKLTLVRNRLDGDLDLAITVALDAGGYDESRPMELRFGGVTPISLAMGQELETRHNVSNQYFIADAELEERVIEAMQERNAVTLMVPLSGVERLVEIGLSLRGVMASLDFMSTYARRVSQY